MEEFLMQTSCYFREPCMQVCVVCVWWGVVWCVWGGVVVVCVYLFWLWNQKQSLTWCFPFSLSFSLPDPTLCSFLADVRAVTGACLPSLLLRVTSSVYATDASGRY